MIKDSIKEGSIRDMIKGSEGKGNMDRDLIKGLGIKGLEIKGMNSKGLTPMEVAKEDLADKEGSEEMKDSEAKEDLAVTKEASIRTSIKDSVKISLTNLLNGLSKIPTLKLVSKSVRKSLSKSFTSLTLCNRMVIGKLKRSETITQQLKGLI